MIEVFQQLENCTAQFFYTFKFINVLLKTCSRQCYIYIRVETIHFYLLLLHARPMLQDNCRDESIPNVNMGPKLSVIAIDLYIVIVNLWARE